MKLNTIGLVCTCVVAVASFSASTMADTEKNSLRPPSVPLVACDPYFSIWSPANNLTDAGTVHWTGKPQPMNSLIRIDDKTFRLMGTEPATVPPLPQKSVKVLPTRTLYTFAGDGVQVNVTFTTPALPEDLMIYSRPVTYVSWEVLSTDGKGHTVKVYFDASPNIAVNDLNQSVQSESVSISGLATLRCGTVEQPVLLKHGDDLRIDWGYFYVSAPKSLKPAFATANGAEARQAFTTGNLPSGAADATPRSPKANAPVLAFGFDLGTIGTKKASTCWLILAYDDNYSIQYFKKNLKPYWRRNGAEATDLLKLSANQYHSLVKRCTEFDADVMAMLRKAGGEQYAQICALAYRQCCAANKVAADENGQPLLFPKENFSNGCIATVDVIYPMAPQFLLFSPSLAKAMLVPIMDYASSPRWRWPFAPHDLGTYPHANGQVYGGGERTEDDQMPVEETGNMIILLAALAHVEGNADFCAPYWPILDKWAAYLKDKGFDPENQLCTDDFAGHLAHNVNLSAKAICGLGAYAKLCEQHGEKAKAQEYLKLAKEFAARWVKEADDGDHFRLAFDKPGTWSQKYNLVWDRILGLNLFPDSVLKKEMAFYRKSQNRYGLPLDNRQPYTKLDWTIWTSTLTGSAEDMQAIVAPVYAFLNETPNRVPMTDWFRTPDAKHVGFQARSVVGGVFIKMLYDQPTWKRWVSKDKTKAAKWAPLPKPPKITCVVPAADTKPATWFYTVNKPTEQWANPGFTPTDWKEGQSGFGAQNPPGAHIHTSWTTGDIWIRRDFELTSTHHDLQLWIHHDENAEIYINGVFAARISGYSTTYDAYPINSKAKATLKSGKNTIAIHCHQTTGGQYIDAGLVDVE